MLFSSIARALVKYVGNAVGFGMAGSAALEIWDDWSKSKADKQEKAAENAMIDGMSKAAVRQQMLAEIETIAVMSQETARQLATDAVKEVAGDRSEAEQQALVAYITQVPNVIRQSQRRPSDPSGRTLSSALRLNGPQDLARLLPQRGPRFKVGDRPIGIGDWELEELLGMGGFGEVWKAKNPYLPYSVALKFCVDSEAAKMLHHEGKVLAQVMKQGKQPGIVQLLRTYFSAEVPCLEYELVTGGDLTSLANRLLQRYKGQLPIDLVTKIMRNIVRGVRFAHRLSPPIVHRDLKPANVLVQPREEGKFELRIADFGIGGVAATRALEQIPTQETTTSVLGSCTPLYASPQQAHGEAPDPRDDVHALGVIWYQLLVGDLNSPVGIEWHEQLAERQVPQIVISLIGRCVSPKADKRPADAAVLAEEIDKLINRLPLLLTKPQPPGRADDEPRCGRDAWDSRNGSSNAKVNAVILASVKPVTASDIAGAAGLRKKQVRWLHLQDLIHRGLVTRDGSMYRLVSPAGQDQRPRDKYGYDAESDYAKVNGAISAVPKTIEEILQGASLSKDWSTKCRDHLNCLRERGIVVTEGSAYRFSLPDDASSKAKKPIRSKSVKSELFSALSEKPATMRELMASANIEFVQYGYLNQWIKEGLVKKTDEGYVLVTKTPTGSIPDGKFPGSPTDKGIRSPADSATKGSREATAFITYENIRNPHVTIHAEGCSQIRKRGGEHAQGQGKYKTHGSLPDARLYADQTGLPVILCSFCKPSGWPEM